jgi:hypothetical protein
MFDNTTIGLLSNFIPFFMRISHSPGLPLAILFWLLGSYFYAVTLRNSPTGIDYRRGVSATTDGAEAIVLYLNSLNLFIRISSQNSTIQICVYCHSTTTAIILNQLVNCCSKPY